MYGLKHLYKPAIHPISWGLSYLTPPSIGRKRIHGRLQTKGMVAFVTHVAHKHFCVLSRVSNKANREMYRLREHFTIVSITNTYSENTMLCFLIRYFLFLVNPGRSKFGVFSENLSSIV